MVVEKAPETSITYETLEQRVESIAPVIRRHSAEAEENARLSDEVVTALKDAGFLRLHLPKAYGGYELDPVSFFRISELISRIDSAVGWQMGISNSMAFIGSYLSE